MMEDDQLADILLAERLIDPSGLDEARRQQQRHGGDLYTVLIENGHVDEAKTITLVARQLNIPCVSLSEFDADEETLQLIPAQMAADYRVIPLGVQASEGIYLAMSNPIDFNALEVVNQHTGLDVHAFLVGPLDLDRALERCYGHAIYQGSAAMLGSDPFAGPSVSQLLELPVLSDDFEAPISTEEPPGSLKGESIDSVRSIETLLPSPSPLIHAPPPLLSVDDLAQLEAFGDEDEEILEVDLEGFADNQVEDIFEVRSSRIFMVPEQLSEAGQQRLRESKAEQSGEPGVGNGRTRMGYFRVEDEPDLEPSFERGAGGPGPTFEVEVVSQEGEVALSEEDAVSVGADAEAREEPPSKEQTQLIEEAAEEPPQGDVDSRLRGFPRELTDRSVQVLHQVYQSHDALEVVEAVETGDLIRATVRALLKSGVLRDADLLRELAALHVQDNEED